mmetsp:Transcript_5675/g.8767  ORF Transcript_5675/g.8767 Transcript_5675/m.8767 type:complete len:390 (+) Transcript_5675:234-1403(+)
MQSSLNASSPNQSSGADHDTDDRQPTYWDAENRTILGCSHYQRSCKIYAACCCRFFPCHWCHDDQTSDGHVMNRRDSRQVLCMRCGTAQASSNSCVSDACSSAPSFSSYYCSACCLYENNAAKHIYHCEKCGICRVGRGLDIDYFHCDKCSACISVEHKNHKCVENNTKSNCPICFDYMFTSRNPVVITKCGHAMHEACFKLYTGSHMYTCPVCFKSLGDLQQLFSDLDSRLENEPRPTGYDNIRNRVTCNDCERRSITRYHPRYHKCSLCGSYNTTVLENVRVDADGNPIQAVAQQAVVDPGVIQAPEPEVPLVVDGIVQQVVAPRRRLWQLVRERLAQMLETIGFTLPANVSRLDKQQLRMVAVTCLAGLAAVVAIHGQSSRTAGPA